MKMSGEEIIAAPRQVVWDALNDPEVLKQCITGCEEIKKKSDTEMEAKVTAKVGPVKASFVGAMKLSKLNPPRSYVISGEGKGGMAGFAKGGATVQLSDTADGQTKLSYDVDAQVGGKLAQIGSRLIDSTAKKMAADFFKKFNKVVSDRAQAAGTEEKSKPAAKKSVAKKPAAKKSAAKKSASKKAASTTAAAASAAKPAAKKAAGKSATKASAAGTAAKKAAKKTASKTTKTAAAASSTAKASVKSAKTTTKSAAKSAKKATKSATKSASKAASKATKKASGKAASAANSAVSTVEGAAAEARQASVQTAATASNAVETAAASASAGADKVANTMPPQAKSMSTMWMLVMAAAAIGLLLIWASGKG
jgi:carbon monoxide dehydrogenase subunit G